MHLDKILWKGPPIFYPRGEGSYGLIMGKRHYLFSCTGELESMNSVSEPVLNMVLDKIKPQSVTAPAAFIAKIKE